MAKGITQNDYIEIIAEKMLDEQALEDVYDCYKQFREENQYIFWDILRAVGCEIEFKEYLEEKCNENEE